MKKLILSAAIAMSIFASLSVLAQPVLSLHHKAQLTIGFQKGKETTPFSSFDAPAKVFVANTSRVYIKKTLGKHFAIESGLNYSGAQNNMLRNYMAGKQMPAYSVSVPVTMQYYLLPEGFRLRPYCGAGALCNLYNSPATVTSLSDGPVAAPGTKYVSIQFVQGITFEVNTKIQFTESIHFIPRGNDNLMGIDIGIGFKL